MLVLDKERIKEILNKHGVKLGHFISQYEISRSHFENMTHAKVRGAKLDPVVKLPIGIAQQMAKDLGTTLTDITIKLTKFRV